MLQIVTGTATSAETMPAMAPMMAICLPLTALNRASSEGVATDMRNRLAGLEPDFRLCTNPTFANQIYFILKYWYMAKGTTSKLNPKQEQFCQPYASDREFFGKGVESYIEVYKPRHFQKGLVQQRILISVTIAKKCRL